MPEDKTTKYEGLQVLGVGPLYFALPDDFKGTVSDALRLLADYHEDPVSKQHRVVVVPEDESKSYSTLWADFLEAVDEGYRVLGVLSHCQVVGSETVLKSLD